jgi:hypothetical protein
MPSISGSTICGSRGMLSRTNGGARGPITGRMVTMSEIKQRLADCPNRKMRRIAKKLGITLEAK